MSDDGDPLVRLPLAGLHTSDDERGVFARTDTEATLAKVDILAAAAIYFDARAIRDYGGRPGTVRARGLVEQVVGAAFQTYERIDPHADPFERAAMLLRGVTQGHPFGDGNKRTGFLLAAYYLDVTGYSWPAALPVDQIVEFCVRVSSGEIRDVREIADALRRFWGVSVTDP